MPHYTALVTLLAVLLYFYTGILVAKARGKYGVKAPATTGNPDFERVFRVQMNTLEWMPILLPALWLFAIYVNDWAAALLGLVWIVGRVLYIRGYSVAAEQRHRGFSIQAFASGALLIGALVGIIWRMVQRLIKDCSFPRKRESRAPIESMQFNPWVPAFRPSRSALRRTRTRRSSRRKRRRVAGTNGESHSAALVAMALALLPIAALTRGITCSAISCIERLASCGSTQSMPA